MSPPVTQQTPLGGSLATAREARRYVRGLMHDHRVSEKVTGIVELLTSEVVTNALLHARGAHTLTVSVLAAAVRVEVEDPCSLLPARRSAGVDAVSGRGLTIVAALARDWGVEVGPRGKRVWFEVAREDSASRRPGSRSAWDDRNSQN